jgi:hypothetical protein
MLSADGVAFAAKRWVVLAGLLMTYGLSSW